MADFDTEVKNNDEDILSDIDNILNGNGENLIPTFDSSSDIMNSDLSDEELLSLLSASDFQPSGNLMQQEETLAEVDNLLQAYTKTDASLSGANSPVNKVTYPFIYCTDVTQLEYTFLQSLPTPKSNFIDFYKKSEKRLAKLASIPLEFEKLLDIIKYNPTKELKVKLTKEEEIPFEDFMVTQILRG